MVHSLIFGINLRDLGEIMNAYYRASKFSSALVLYFLCHSVVLDRLLWSVTDHAHSLETEYQEKILICVVPFGYFSEWTGRMLS